MSLDQRFAETMGQLLGPDFPSDIALAVSGGGDSIAMLSLAHNWTRHWGVRLHVVTVDHGLRDAAVQEAAFVAETCRELGWPHVVLRWTWDGSGNVMDAARRARLDLIDAWRGEIRHVLMGHTRDDVAETFLMRLARGAGLDGLSAMSQRRRVGGLEVLRPCLEMTRAELRHYLTVLKGRWVEDPTNGDPSFDRARIRAALGVLEAEGLGVDALAGAAMRLGSEKEALIQRAAAIWAGIGEALCVPGGDEMGLVALRPDWSWDVEIATQRRVLAAVLRRVGGQAYPPRGAALERFRDRLVSGGAGTLHGCDVVFRDGWALVFREYEAVRAVTVPALAGAMWDGRWRLREAQMGCDIRALGEDGWAQLDTRAEFAPPFRAALSLPAIWRGGDLVACDGVGLGPGRLFEPVDWPLDPVRFLSV